MRISLPSFIACMLLLLEFIQEPAAAQPVMKYADSNKNLDSIPRANSILDINPRLVMIDDTLWVLSGICKTLKKTKYSEPLKSIPSNNTGISQPRNQLITVHGNVEYDFLHRSFVDTPFSQRNFQQHTLRTSLKIVIKDKYPLNLNISTRQSNSPYFRDIFDIGLRFDPQAYARNTKKDMVEKLMIHHPDLPKLDRLEKMNENLISEYNSLKNRLNDPDILQKLIEERKAAFYKSVSGNEPAISGIGNTLSAKADVLLVNDSSLKEKYTTYSDYIETKRHQLDSLSEKISEVKNRIDSLQSVISAARSGLSRKVYAARNPKELQRIAKDNDLELERPNALDRFLENVKTFGVGRSFVNYSELTAWNVSLTGINLEYNPHIYAAIAAGKIDYGWRDFFGKTTSQKGQQMLLGRVGWGNIEKKAIIFSAFTGRKNSYGSIQADTLSSRVQLAGYSVEAIWKLNRFTNASAEIAKSTKPASGNFRDNNELKSLFDFADKTNVGVSLKAQTELQQSHTRLSGFYRRSGANFQSFSLFSYNTDQTSWAIKGDQSFWKDRINVVAMVRRNDFTSPFTIKTFKTSTVFTTLQASMRLKKMPVISVGYFPGTQWYVEDKQTIRENAYYILNGSLVHTLPLGGGNLISSAIYNRYSSKGTDSGFIAYRGVNYMFTETFQQEKIRFQGSYTYNDQEEMRYYTLEGGADISITSFLRVGASGKYNKVFNGETYWGNRVQLNIEIKKLGTLQGQYEKSFLPTIYGTLFPVEMGRISWFKYF